LYLAERVGSLVMISSGAYPSRGDSVTTVIGDCFPSYDVSAGC
jgi:hypothetical protein